MERYIITSPALSKVPPMMSVIQCTTRTSLPITMKTVETVIDREGLKKYCEIV